MIYKIILYLFIYSFINGSDINSPGKISTVDSNASLKYLALGDSYTIGEMVPSKDNFPNQFCEILNKASINVTPRIIAKTGWTTDELEAAIKYANEEDPIEHDHDLVTLLIGVNDQYRGRPSALYAPAFEELLKKAILYAGSNAKKVIVISIPDWGVTPFAEGRDRQGIASSIDEYNALNKKYALQCGVNYLDITGWTREAAHDQTLLASDGLHPSAKAYRQWAEALVEIFTYDVLNTKKKK
jgi:lysophospholipase L1-like esterase